MPFLFLTRLTPALVILSLSRSAFADNTSDAADELKAGYALKLAGNCRDAIPHFARSFALDPRPKPLLNRADCDARLGDLVGAQAHAAEGRQLAQQAGDKELVGVADEQLSAVDRRLPRLTIRVARAAPPGIGITRDGVLVDMSLLGVAVAVNAGSYRIAVTAPGYAPRELDVTLAEGETEQIEVAPGGKLDPVEASAPSREVVAHEGGGAGPRRPLALVAFGAGVVGLSVGLGAGIAGSSKHATLVSRCPDNRCPSAEQGDLDSFHSLRIASTIGYVVGVASLAGGAVLWFTVPNSGARGTSAYGWIGPQLAGVGAAF